MESVARRRDRNRILRVRCSERAIHLSGAPIASIAADADPAQRGLPAPGAVAGHRDAAPGGPGGAPGCGGGGGGRGGGYAGSRPPPSWPAAVGRWRSSTPTTSGGARARATAAWCCPSSRPAPHARAAPRRARAAAAPRGGGRLRPRRGARRGRRSTAPTSAPASCTSPTRTPAPPTSPRSATSSSPSVRPPTSCAATTWPPRSARDLRRRARRGAQRRAPPGPVPRRARGARRGAPTRRSTRTPRRPRSTPGRPVDRSARRAATSTPDDVLVTTNAYADALVPALRRRVLPMGSYIIATEPLEPALAKEVLPTGRMCFNDRNLLWYWRLDDEGRMVFGGRKQLGRVSLDEARDFLYRRCSRCTRSSPASASNGPGAATWPSPSTASPTAAGSTASGTPPAATARASPSTPGSATAWPAPCAVTRSPPSRS